MEQLSKLVSVYLNPNPTNPVQITFSITHGKLKAIHIWVGCVWLARLVSQKHSLRLHQNTFTGAKSLLVYAVYI